MLGYPWISSNHQAWILTSVGSHHSSLLGLARAPAFFNQNLKSARVLHNLLAKGQGQSHCHWPGFLGEAKGIGHQEEQRWKSVCFLKALQNIHLGQLRITFPSPFCVAGVGRSIFTLFWIYKILKLLENATGVRQSSTLGFYGERVCRWRRRNHICWLSEAQQAQV
jgi:hypothetical protein